MAITLRAAICAALSALLLASCGHAVLSGRAVSMLYDPDRVGGLAVSEGPSGPRGVPPPVTDRVQNTDGGDDDRLALFAIDDIEDFWQRHYSDSFSRTFSPVSTLLSYDSNDRFGPAVCGNETYGNTNAMYCHRKDTLAWDRGSLIPTARKYFGDMAVNALLAHEYGHAVQRMAKLIHHWTPTLVREQQADCLSGVYLRWVAGGESPRFQLSTGDDLSHILAGAIVIRDPISSPTEASSSGDPHGTALDRVTALQRGFDSGAEACGEIDSDEIQQRRGDLPSSLFESDSPQSDVGIDDDTLSTMMELLGKIFAPANPPTLSSAGTSCNPGSGTEAVVYCPSANTISVNMPVLQRMGAPSDESQLGLPRGDNTALSVFTSRYVLALQHERGLPLDSALAGMRAACLTGVAQRNMAEPIALPSGKMLVLGAGDLDEAISGLLTNGLAASDVNGTPVPAGFSRIFAFHSGLLSGAGQCYQRFS